MKLSPLTIYIIGISLALPIIAFGWFFNLMPNSADTASYDAATQLNQAEAAKQPQAEKRVKDAIAMIKTKAAEWRAIAAVRTPPESLSAGGISLTTNAFQLTEDTRKFRNSIQRAVNAQLRKGGVEVINGPMVPVPDANAPANSLLASFYNFPGASFPVVIFDLGTVTVQGSYNEIMNHVRAYKNMPRYLAVTDGLRLDGTSPNLTATYNLTIVGYIRGTGVYGQAPEGGATGGQGAGAPAGPGGPPRGPGGPGGPPTGGAGKMGLGGL
ncbi:MAG TPA: hypothetical protein VK934_09160 [Fimbriimonas sp.]|nr:hypothetical protein [Fimbriimonas sp.]